MERLTHKRSNGIKSGYWSPVKKEELIQHLAAYEDTGITPDQLKIINEEYSRMSHELAMFRQQNRWIPVTEKLPDEGQAVLVTRTSRLGNYVTNDEYDWDYCAWESDADDIIAWMPLPEPYKE